MKPEDWFVEQNRQRAERGEKRLYYSTIADQVGVTSQTVWAHFKGVKRPSAELIVAYQQVTNGAVQLADWFPDAALPAVTPPKPKRRAA